MRHNGERTQWLQIWETASKSILLTVGRHACLGGNPQSFQQYELGNDQRQELPDQVLRTGQGIILTKFIFGKQSLPVAVEKRFWIVKTPKLPISSGCVKKNFPHKTTDSKKNSSFLETWSRHLLRSRPLRITGLETPLSKMIT